jgi:site-specific DNA-methyltransferase (adenine-specific)
VRRAKQSKQAAFAVEMVPIGNLEPAPYNPRKIKAAALQALTEELRAYGLVEPLVANRRADGRLVVVGGHQRLKAAQALAWASVPVRVLEVDEVREKALNVALNNPALQGEWDQDRLAGLLKDLPSIDANLAGFSESALVRILGAPEACDDAPPLPREPRTKPGELIELGAHRLLCGDARQAQSYSILFDGHGPAVCLWTDPPFGVRYVGGTRRRMTMENDEEEQTENLLACAFGAVNNHLSRGASAYVCSPSGRGYMAFLRAFTSVPWDYRQGLIWRKDAMVLGHSDYHYVHESILYGFTPGDGRRGHGGDGWYGGSDQVSVFDVPRPKASREHPTMKPVALIEAHLRNSTKAGDIVLDPFGGSGSTLIAAHRLGRRAFLMEIDPAYCDVIRDRYAAACGSGA